VEDTLHKLEVEEGRSPVEGTVADTAAGIATFFFKCFRQVIVKLKEASDRREDGVLIFNQVIQLDPGNRLLIIPSWPRHLLTVSEGIHASFQAKSAKTEYMGPFQNSPCFYAAFRAEPLSNVAVFHAAKCPAM
jgi:hypothetical protein